MRSGEPPRVMKNDAGWVISIGYDEGDDFEDDGYYEEGRLEEDLYDEGYEDEARMLEEEMYYEEEGFFVEEGQEYVQDTTEDFFYIEDPQPVDEYYWEEVYSLPALPEVQQQLPRFEVVDRPPNLDFADRKIPNRNFVMPRKHKDIQRSRKKIDPGFLDC